MKLNQFVDYLTKIEKTSSRNQMTILLAELLKTAKSTEIDKICYLSLGELAPKYRGIEFNMAEKLMLRVIAKAFNLPENKIKQEFKKSGDLGEVVQTLGLVKTHLKIKDLSVEEVYNVLLAIAQDEGEGSQERKINKMAQLISRVSPQTARYLIRIPLGKVRLGFSEITILDALSWMIKGDKSLRPIFQTAFNVSADVGAVAKIVKQKGIKGIKKLQAQVGIPIMPALTERETDLEKILVVRMAGLALIEPKYDGFRVQIHLDKKRKEERATQKTLFKKSQSCFVRIFSRNLENITLMLPEIAEKATLLPVNSAIFDGEAIGFDPKTGRFLPFQETTQRKRKYDIEQALKKIPLKVFIFDLLYYNGKTLIAMPLCQRRKLLERIFAQKSKDSISLTEQTPAKTTAEINKLFNLYIKKGLEGIIIKEKNSPYHAGQRKFNWIKYKRGMSQKLVDTVDCLVMGYYFGRGKRSQFGIGAFLVGIYDEQKEQFYTIAKIGTGLTDDQWRQLKEKADQFKTNQPPKEYFVPKELIPDIWINPALVVEIAADEITKSPVHSCKFALRFPRLTKFRAKNPQEATTLKEIKKLYQLQK